MGIGFTLALVAISFIRELIGTCVFDFSGFMKDAVVVLKTPLIYIDRETSSLILNILGKEFEIFSGSFVFVSPAGAFVVYDCCC